MAAARIDRAAASQAGSPKMAAEPNWFALQMRVNPILDPLRNDPRFEKIAGSVVLKPVPPNTTVAGVPAKEVGTAGCAEPSRAMDQMLYDLGP